MDLADQDLIHLKSGQIFITHEEEDAFMVRSGSILLYIVPWTHNQAGRRALLCSMEAGSVIPAFSFRDMDYQDWRFCITTLENADLLRMPGASTGYLRHTFLNRAGIPANRDSYGDALVNRYRMNLVQEDGYFVRTDREKQDLRERTDTVIETFFSCSAAPSAAEGDSLYQTLFVLCGQAGIDIAPYDRIRQACSGEIRVNDIGRISGFPCREVLLEENWYRTSCGYLLVSLGEDEYAACVPQGLSGYRLYRPGRSPVRLTEKLAAQCELQAWMIYRPLPSGEVSLGQLLRFCRGCLSRSELLLLLLLILISGFISLLIPVLAPILIDWCLPLLRTDLIIQAGLLAFGLLISGTLFSAAKSTCLHRICGQISVQTREATYARVFTLPESFLRSFDRADLADRMMTLSEMAEDAAEHFFSFLSNLFLGVLYLGIMVRFSPSLSLICAGVLLAELLLSLLLARRGRILLDQELTYRTRTETVLNQFLQGIEKLRISGMEERAVFEYIRPFLERRKFATGVSEVSVQRNLLPLLCSGAAFLLCFRFAYGTSALSLGQLIGFFIAFESLSLIAGALAEGCIFARTARDEWQRVEPLLNTAPESHQGHRQVGTITGQIDMDHVTFGYSRDTEPVLKDLTLHVTPGEYIGIVGPSGCGKSTLLKLLLGFETAQTGRIYYDSQDISDLSITDLRKNFGVVLQNGSLFDGSIEDNIQITNPSAAFEDIEAVLDAVGLTEDIENMPMGLKTVLNESSSMISGGQKQRILLARALLRHPKILFLDEATSALDNRTQAQVCDTLAHMDATRIVIAHRLSTIRSCDRILVMDSGRFVEEGPFETLMAAGGLFHRLAGRQMLQASAEQN